MAESKENMMKKQRGRLLWLCGWIVLMAGMATGQELPLSAFHKEDAKFFKKTSAGTYQVPKAMSVLAETKGAVDLKKPVLEFEYFAIAGVDRFAVLLGPRFDSADARYLPAMSQSEGWTPYAASLEPNGNALLPAWKNLRLDLPVPAGRGLQLRGLRLREERPDEFEKKVSKQKVSKEKLEAYLKKDFPSAIGSAWLGKSEVVLKGKVEGNKDGVWLAETPMDILYGAENQYEIATPLKVARDGSFELRLPRHRVRDGKDFDRMSCRWTLLRKADGGWEEISAAHYINEVEKPAEFPEPGVIRSKKGLGGWHKRGDIPNELEDLGISAVTVNIVLTNLIALEPGKNREAFEWQGRTYYKRLGQLRGLDSQLREAAKHDVVVSAVLLLSNHARGANEVNKLMGHPDAVKEGIYAMPNVTDEDGIALYGAVLKMLTERYGRADGKYGRIHHWIVHNEVDAGWVWTNAGEKSDTVFFDLYQRSMRMVDLFARQMDPNSRAFITLTHHWANPGAEHWYGSKRLTDLLVRYGQVEGEFPWAMAYHPYPQNLFEPRAWNDEQATFDFETKKITPKNIEVLDAYMKLPRLRYKGKVRPIHFSENGFNSRDYSDKELAAQAAGMAYVWKKMEKLSAVEVWHYHNWIDNRKEGGLRIGLRKFPDAKGDPLGKKPIWYVYQAAGTAREGRVFRPYLKVIGIRDWSDAVYDKPIK